MIKVPRPVSLLDKAFDQNTLQCCPLLCKSSDCHNCVKRPYVELDIDFIPDQNCDDKKRNQGDFHHFPFMSESPSTDDSEAVYQHRQLSRLKI